MRVVVERKRQPGKRTLDVALGLALLVVSLPVLVVAWPLAAISTRSAGVFRQRRIGQAGQPFTIHKLQTMVGPDDGSMGVTVGDDARITPVGAVLRRWKVDELPQLIDVIRGPMSIVGPRPETCTFWESVTWEGADILRVRPGMTSPASMGLRNEERILQEVEHPEVFARTDLWPQKVQLNREYIAHWSLGLDVEVMVKTVGLILHDLLGMS